MFHSYFLLLQLVLCRMAAVKISPHSSLVQIIFYFWSSEIKECILRNQNIIIRRGAVWSGPSLFAIPFASFGQNALWFGLFVWILCSLQQSFLVSENLGTLREFVLKLSASKDCINFYRCWISHLYKSSVCRKVLVWNILHCLCIRQPTPQPNQHRVKSFLNRPIT